MVKCSKSEIQRLKTGLRRKHENMTLAEEKALLARCRTNPTPTRS